MFLSTETEKLGESEFKWLKKKESVQFYESFVYDKVHYSLYDCVYMHAQGQSEIYIGKLVRIWENADKSKQVEVQWFFRPSEVMYHLGDKKMLDDELLFATGDGPGLRNINSVEAISGKCSVVCISTDSRNPQPSAEEVLEADYVFYRTFNVTSYLISDQMGESVGGLPVEFVFNRKGSEKTKNIQKLASKGKYAEANINGPDLGRDGVMGTMDKRTVAAKSFGSTVNDKKDIVEGLKSPVKQVLVKGRGAFTQTFNDLDFMPSKRVKYDTFTSSMDKNRTGVPSLTISGNDATLHGNEVVESLSRGKPGIRFRTSEDADATNADNITNPLNDEDAILASNRKMGENVKSLDQTPSKTDAYTSAHSNNYEKVSFRIKKRSSTNILSPNLTPKKGCVFDGLGRAVVIKDSSALLKNPLKTNTCLIEEDSNHGHGKRSISVTKDSCHAKGASLKRVKDDYTINFLRETNKSTIEKLKRDGAGESKKSPTHDTVIRKLFKTSVELDTNQPNVYGDKKIVKLSDANFSNLCVASSKVKGIDMEVEDKLDEIVQRPITEKRSWLRELPWEESVKIALKDGRLVILQNLPPGFTSKEVEDIIYDAFKEENGKARMMQSTAISSPHSGQALLIFKSVGAAQRVVKKLDDGCLMLQNQRPLVGYIPKFLEKRTGFHGHLTINKFRHQMQREMKEAVSTAHFAQPNTVEHDMAMDWLFLQSKSEQWWERLYKEQERQMGKLLTGLKFK